MRTLKITTLNSIKQQPWIDRDYLLFHSCFQILVDFAEKEDGLKYWGNEALNLKELYDWWKNIDPEFDLMEDEAQEKLEELVRLRRYLWT